MNDITFKSIVKANLKAAGVRRFVDMRERNASNLFRRLKRALPFNGSEESFISKLETLGYYQAKKYLVNTLPKLTIGNVYSDEECGLLNSLELDKAIALFDGLPADRAGNMWHAFYNYSKPEAISFLDTLANTNNRTFRHALVGGAWLKEEHVPMISELFKYCIGRRSLLPTSLVKLGDPMIMKAVKGLSYTTLADFFIKNYLFQIDFSMEDQEVVCSVLRALGAKKAFGFYGHLVARKVISASEYLDEICPDENALEKNSAKNIVSDIQEHIIDYITS
jgi:hypothetical protein